MSDGNFKVKLPAAAFPGKFPTVPGPGGRRRRRRRGNLWVWRKRVCLPAAQKKSLRTQRVRRIATPRFSFTNGHNHQVSCLSSSLPDCQGCCLRLGEEFFPEGDFSCSQNPTARGYLSHANHHGHGQRLRAIAALSLYALAGVALLDNQSSTAPRRASSLQFSTLYMLRNSRTCLQPPVLAAACSSWFPMADAISCLQPLCDCLDGTGLLDAAGREVASFLRLKSNWGDLDKARESLGAVERMVRGRVTAELNKLNVCDPQVELWLRRVDELKLGAIDEDYSSLMNYSSICQCTRHAARRSWIGKRIVEALDEVNKLIEEGRRFKKFGFKPSPEIVERLPQTKTFGLETMLVQLHDLLEKADSNIIGIWGQGGIGKTTLLHAFNNDLEKKVHNYQVMCCFLKNCILLCIRLFLVLFWDEYR